MTDNADFHTDFHRHLDGEHLGFEVVTDVNGLRLFICFYLGKTDFDIIPSILPPDRFDNDTNIHIGELTNNSDITEELESILANMDNGDTVVFFCATQESIQSALAFLNFPVDAE